MSNTQTFKNMVEQIAQARTDNDYVIFEGFSPSKIDWGAVGRERIREFAARYPLSWFKTLRELGETAVDLCLEPHILMGNIILEQTRAPYFYSRIVFNLIMKKEFQEWSVVKQIPKDISFKHGTDYVFGIYKTFKCDLLGGAREEMKMLEETIKKMKGLFPNMIFQVFQEERRVYIMFKIDLPDGWIVLECKGCIYLSNHTHGCDTPACKKASDPRVHDFEDD